MSTDPFNMKTYPPSEGSEEVKEALKELSRYKYGRSAKMVNAEIEDRFKRVGLKGEKQEEEKDDDLSDFKSLLG